MARHLIIGGTGFVGRQVAKALYQSGESVVVAGRSSVGASPRVGEPLQYVCVDILCADWVSLLSDFDIIHHYAWSSIPHTAASDPLEDVNRHVTPTLAMLEAAKALGGKRLIFLSSGGTVYGALPSGVAREIDFPKPLTIYGATKLAVENYLRVYHVAGEVDCAVVRLSNPYGHGQSLERNQGLVTTFVAKAMAGEQLNIWGDGTVVRDYIHVSDVARALVLLSAHKPVARSEDLPIYNVASGYGASINEVIQTIEHHIGHPLDVVRSEARRIDLPVSVLDISRTQGALSWSPQLSLSDGIALLLAQCAQAGR